MVGPYVPTANAERRPGQQEEREPQEEQTLLLPLFLLLGLAPFAFRLGLLLGRRVRPPFRFRRRRSRGRRHGHRRSRRYRILSRLRKRARFHVIQRRAEGRRGLETFLGTFCEGLQDDRGEHRRQLGFELAGVRRGLLHLCESDTEVAVCVFVPLERRLARERFVQGDSDGVDVRPGIHVGRVFHLLGGHVGGRAHGCTRHGSLQVAHDFGDAEVHDFYDALGRYEDVRGFDVAVDDGLGLTMGIAHRVEHLPKYVQSMGDVHALPAHEVRQRCTFDVFHDDGQGLEAQVFDTDDVRVAELGLYLRFVLEAVDRLGIACQHRIENFDGHDRIRFLVLGPPNRCHAARVNVLQQTVAKHFLPRIIHGHDGLLCR